MISELNIINKYSFWYRHGSANNTQDSEIEISSDNTIFWNRDHKLAISTEVLFPLYAAAKHALEAADTQHKMLTKLPTNRGKSMDETAADSSQFSTDFLAYEEACHFQEATVITVDGRTFISIPDSLLCSKK
ncbi:hypothetical protein MKX03_016568 [Papaver bracteatum]|nr:hypothetical protein MKX03_016568 [Papaver bracteatum]